jgi:hypothetical protein
VKVVILAKIQMYDAGRYNIQIFSQFISRTERTIYKIGNIVSGLEFENKCGFQERY